MLQGREREVEDDGHESVGELLYADQTSDWYVILAGTCPVLQRKDVYVCDDPSLLRFHCLLQIPFNHPKKLNMKTCRTTDAKQKSAKALGGEILISFPDYGT